MRNDGRAVSRRTVLGLAGAACVQACAPGVSSRLTWWAIGATGENAPLLLPPFKRATGIDVQALPWTGAHEKLLTGFAGRSLPDVMMLNDIWLSEMALLGALAPPPPLLLTGQPASALASVKVAGRAVAAPWTANSWMQFYRRDLIAEVGYSAPPLRWEAWKQMARALKRRHPDRFATLHLIDWPEPLLAFAAQQPEPMLRDRATRGNFSSPGFRTALGFYKSIFDEKLSPVLSGAEAGDTYLGFARGDFAILPSDSVSIGDLRRRAAAFPPGSWSVTATPGPGGAGAALARGRCLAVSHDARDPVAAWRLVDYLCGPALQARIYSVVDELPTRSEAEDPIAAAFAEQIARSVAPPAVPEWEQITGEIQLVAEHMVRGEYGVDAAAAEMNARVDRILAKRRALVESGRIV
jgi:multiple sugar transport system substrate-binding protein